MNRLSHPEVGSLVRFYWPVALWRFWTQDDLKASMNRSTPKSHFAREREEVNPEVCRKKFELIFDPNLPMIVVFSSNRLDANEKAATNYPSEQM